MAIRPHEIESFVDGLVKDRTNEIDAKLKDNWSSQVPKPSVEVVLWTLSHPSGDHRAVVQRLKDEYEKAGWEVEAKESNPKFVPTPRSPHGESHWRVTFTISKPSPK